MIDWLHNLPVTWMALVVFGGTYLSAGLIYWVITALAVGARAFKGISPGMLPPLGIIFGLLVAFVAAQVWRDVDRAKIAVNSEASALRAVILLTGSFPGEPEKRMYALVRRHITEAVTQEWPTMAAHHATLTIRPARLGGSPAVDSRPDPQRRRPGGGTARDVPRCRKRLTLAGSAS
jgi:hypothetical protein